MGIEYRVYQQDFTAHDVHCTVYTQCASETDRTNEGKASRNVLTDTSSATLRYITMYFYNIRLCRIASLLIIIFLLC